jgi:hypothetical protein
VHDSYIFAILGIIRSKGLQQRVEDSLPVDLVWIAKLNINIKVRMAFLQAIAGVDATHHKSRYHHSRLYNKEVRE